MAEETAKHLFTSSEAMAFLQKVRGKTFWICGDVQLPIVGDDGKVFPSYATISVTRKQAMNYARIAMCKSFEDRGGRLVIRESANCVWVG